MFPQTLHKNILQLDKQISKLESEWKNIDMDKKKGTMVSRQPQNKCNKLSNFYVKSPPDREINKKSFGGTKKLQRPASPLSSRKHSASSVPSNCSKQGNKICDSCNMSKNKYQGIISNQSFCQVNGNNSNCNYFQSKKNKNAKCNSDIFLECTKKEDKVHENYSNIVKNGDSDCILHKELIFSNPGSTIEVMVRQKSCNDYQNENSLFKKNVETVTCNEENCVCQSENKKQLGQKWCEILSAEPVTENHHTLTCTTNSDDEIKKIFSNNSEKAANFVATQHSCKSNGSLKNDVQCHSLDSKNEVYLILQKFCDNLIKEKEFLSKELVAKNNIIMSLRKREEEFSLLITNLKLNLEKAKEGAKTNLAAIKQVDSIKQKFLEQVKITEALKKDNFQVKQMLDKYALENDRLNTEIRIYKLEIQKHGVLMAGKEAEIRRYKEELGNFQKQITSHLALIKSNAQTVDMKKMMETIIQQNQILHLDDLDSVLMDENKRDLSKPATGLMHSSPTSSKTSAVNSSWKQISSIANNDSVVNIHENGDKEFFQVYGNEDVSVTCELPKFKNELEKCELNEGNDLQSSFRTLTSANEISEVGENVERETLILNGKNEKKDLKRQEIKRKSAENLKISIDELLKNMKLKWTEEIYGASPSNKVTEKFLNGSQISNISE